MSFELRTREQVETPVVVTLSIANTELAGQVELLCAASGLTCGPGPGAFTITDGVLGDLLVHPDGQAPPPTSRESIALPSGSTRLRAVLADLTQPVRAVTIGVLGGAGGVGVSTLTLALAHAAPGAGLAIDLDPNGVGWDAVLGTESTPGLRWGDLTGVDAPLVGTKLSGALPQWDAVALLGRSLPDLTAPADLAATWLLHAARAQYSLVAIDFGRKPQFLESIDALLVVAPATVAGQLQWDQAQNLCTRVPRVGVIWGSAHPDRNSVDAVAAMPRLSYRGDWASRCRSRELVRLARRCLAWVLA